MNRGVPPTEPNARTGEFTPPGMTARARANRESLRLVTGVTLRLAGVDEVLEQPQRIRQRMLLRRAEPARGPAGRLARRPGQHGTVPARATAGPPGAFPVAIEARRSPFVFFVAG